MCKILFTCIISFKYIISIGRFALTENEIPAACLPQYAIYRLK